jgi:hypothetical protein
MGKITEQILPAPATVDEDWRLAEMALQAAQKLAGGTERFEALKRAGQLRNEAANRLLAEGRDSRRPGDK